jgi:hypothetical protein
MGTSVRKYNLWSRLDALADKSSFQARVEAANGRLTCGYPDK